jgi:hypothetical protein
MSPADEMGQRHTAEVVRLRYPSFEDTNLLYVTTRNLWAREEWAGLRTYLLGAEDVVAALREFPRLLEEVRLLRAIIKIHMGEE